MAIADGILSTIVYILSGFVLFFLGKLIYQLFNPKIKVARELVENDNLAFSFAHVGYFAGLLIAIGGVLSGESDGLVNDLEYMGIYGGVSIILLNLSMIVNDKLILSKFDLRKEILVDQNVGTGIIEGANAIATGLVVLGAVHGEGAGFGGPIVTVILYWLLGQGILFVTTWVYNLITPYDIHKHLEKGNIAVGVGYAGAIVAIANLIRNALMHDFESWVITLENVAFNVILGLLSLPLARFLGDKILLPGQNLTDEIVNQERPNIGASVVEAFAYVGGSMLIIWAL